MSYQGIVLMVTMGVAIGYALYSFFREPPQQQQYRTTSDNTNYHHVFEPRSTSQSQDRRRKKPKYGECSICLENTQVNKTLPCGHAFHAHCIDQWLLLEKTCPNCRAGAL